MRVFLASDHAGFELKSHLLKYLEGQGHTTVDKGPFVKDDRDDYPDFVRLVAEEILKEPSSSRGVILGKSGQGEAMAANRFKGIRAAVYYGGDLGVIKHSREENDCNILSLGAEFLTPTEAENALNLWMTTIFTGAERHTRRIRKLDQF